MNERELLQKTALSTIKSFQVIDDQLATINFSVTKILWNKHMIVGATILDLVMFHVSVSLSKNETKS